MAGIAFNLKKLLQQETVQSTLAAYFYTALVTSGPWLFSVITLALITVWGQMVRSEIEVLQFMGLTIYSFAGSMILTGGTQMVITRQISDCLYSQEDSKIAGIFTGSCLVTLGLGSVGGLTALWFLQLPLWTSLLTFVLFLLTNLMWITMVFISTLKAYMQIVWAFLLGFVLAIPVSLIAGYYWGVPGFLLGFNAGLSFIVFLLVSSIAMEFKGTFRPSSLVWKAHKKYGVLYLTGASASLGIWIDKMLFWYWEGETVVGFLKIYPVYDGALFVAYLTVIPAMAFFVMIIETEFFESLRRYFFLVEDKAPYLTLEYARQDLIAELKKNGTRILIFQIIVTTVIIFVSPWLLMILHLDWTQWGIFRMACVGAFFHMGFSLVGIVLAYFDCRLEFLLVNVLFTGINLLVTWWTLGDFWLYGLGYVIAGMVACGVGAFLAFHRLKRLHYYTFAAPPIVV